MRTTYIRSLASLAVLAMTACSNAAGPSPAPDNPAPDNPAPDNHVVAGWYLQRDGQHFFQACGQNAPQAIAVSDELLAKARSFDMQDNMPVYARLALAADQASGVDRVARVEQFGADAPVKNCAMNGVAIPPPADDSR